MRLLLHPLIVKGVCDATAFFLLCVICLASPHGAQASQWHLTGQSADGLAQQFVDLDSLRGSGDLWTVESYFIEQRPRQDRSSIPTTRANYTTTYDCASLSSGGIHRYKDIAPDGSESEQWGDASVDVLNQATMDYVCQYRVVGQE